MTPRYAVLPLVPVLLLGTSGTDHRPTTTGAVPIPIFSSIRHRAVVDEAGPYRITIGQIAGPRPIRGWLHYTVRAAGVKGSKYATPLQSHHAATSWYAEIPGQSAGTDVSYMFRFEFMDGGEIWHPRRAPAVAYLLRIRPVILDTLEVSPSEPASSEAVTVTAAVRAAVHPRGVLRYRIDRGEFTHESPLTVTAVGDHYSLLAKFRPLPRGSVADYYFQLEVPPHLPVRIPTDAPLRFLSIKPNRPRVTSLTGGDRVSAVVATPQRLWVGLGGGGLLDIAKDRVPVRRTVADGLPSSVIRGLAADPSDETLYVATPRGAVALRPESSRVEPVIWQPFYRQDNPVFAPLNRAGDVNLIAVCPLDGSVILQTIPLEKEAESPPRATLFRLVDDRLSRLSLPADSRFVELTASFFDEVDGCFLFGATFLESHRRRRPALLRLCGDRFEQWFIGPLSLNGPMAVVEAIARDPTTGAHVLALSNLATSSDRPESRSSVLTFFDGRLSPLSQKLADLPSPITSLLTDWLRNRLLVGTFGQAILSFDGNDLRTIDQRHGLGCSDVAALAAVGSGSAGVLVATHCGLYCLDGETLRPLHRDLLETRSIQANLAPMDFDEVRHRLLLSAPAGGITVLNVLPDGTHTVDRALVGGVDLPRGVYGRAIFSRDAGFIYAILRSQGLLAIENARVKLYTQADGLYSNDISYLLRHSETSQLWLAFPMQGRTVKTAAVQILDGLDHGELIPLPDPIVSALLVSPERRSVFAAGPRGILEVHSDGSVARHSGTPTAALGRDAGSGAIVAVGAAIERWDGNGFRPVTAVIQHPRFPPGQFYLRSPRALAIDTNGQWHVLHPDGYLVTRDPAGRILRILDSEDGVPTSANTLFYIAPFRLLAVGSTEEGIVFIHDP